MDFEPLGCDCYGGCWGDHSADWHKVRTPMLDAAKLWCRDNVGYGFCVFGGLKREEIEIRLALEVDRDRLLEHLDMQALFMIGEELARAREKFPRPDNLLAALFEEGGETAKALLQSGNGDDSVAEAMQTAAMAVRLMVEGDPGFDHLDDVARHK